jgi:hypothetical protein
MRHMMLLLAMTLNNLCCRLMFKCDCHLIYVLDIPILALSKLYFVALGASKYPTFNEYARYLRKLQAGVYHLRAISRYESLRTLRC